MYRYEDNRKICAYPSLIFVRVLVLMENFLVRKQPNPVVFVLSKRVTRIKLWPFVDEIWIHLNTYDMYLTIVQSDTQSFMAIVLTDFHDDQLWFEPVWRDCGVFIVSECLDFYLWSNWKIPSEGIQFCLIKRPCKHLETQQLRNCRVPHIW